MSHCVEVREILVAVARGEKVSARDGRLLGEHVEACAHCRRQMANERMLSAGLAGVASAAALPPAEVKAALMAEFRGRQVVVPIRRPVFQWAAIGALAASVLLAVFVWGLLPRGRRTETAIAPAKAPVAVAQVAAVAPLAVEAKPARQAGSRPTRRRLRPTTKVEEAPEVATDFIEIPYIEPLRPEERADVFRIQMPRANMAVFGLPVTGGRLDSRITADVLMGEDGVVRAVRFVHSMER